MKVCTCFLMFGIFAYTTASLFTKEKVESDVIALKTVEENSKNDFDLTNKAVTGDNTKSEPYSNVKTFIDFITEAISILNTYTDDTFEDFVHNLDKEIRNHFKNHDIKTLLYEQLDLVLKKPISEMRAAVSQAAFGMIIIKFDDNMKQYIDHINSLYKTDDKNNFRKILTELKGYDAGYGKTRTKDDVVKTVREFMKASVFNYDDLNKDLIRELKKYIAPFFKKAKEFSSTTSLTTKFILLKPTVNKLDRYNVKKISTEDIIYKDSLKENRRIRTVIVAPRIDQNINIKEHFIATDTVSNSDKYKVKITKRQSTKHEIPKTSFKTNPTTSNPHLKAKNKRTTIFKTKTREVKEEDETTIHERTSKKEQSSRQEKKITDPNINEAVTEMMRYVTMEEPEMCYKSERRSKLVVRMMGESGGRERGRTTAQTTTKQGLRLSTESSFRRIKPVPSRDDEISVEVFDKERSKKKNVVEELKDYMKRKRQIKKEVNTLKKIDEINQNSNAKVITEEDVDNFNEIETKDKQYNNEQREKNNILFSGGKSHEYETRVLREKDIVINAGDNAESTTKTERRKNRVKNTKDSGEMKVQREENKVNNNDKVIESEENIEKEANVLRTSKAKNKINRMSEDGHNLEISDEIVRSNDNNAQKLKFTRSKSKKYKKYATCDIVDVNTSTKPYKNNKVTRIIEPLATTKVNIDNTTVKNKKHDNTKSKKNKVLRIIKPRATAKDNTDNTTVNNKKLHNTRSKTTNKVVNTTPNVSKELKQNRINNTVTDSNNIVTEDSKNEMLPNHKFRRVLDSFPWLFEGDTLKEGFYPAHLWD